MADFSSRFPDVDMDDFEFLPSPPAFRPGADTGEGGSSVSGRKGSVSVSGQIPKPFHPAPQSTSTYGFGAGLALPARKSSLSSASNGSDPPTAGAGAGAGAAASLSNGYASTISQPRLPASQQQQQQEQHQQQQQVKSPPLPPPSGTKPHRPPLPKPPSAPSLPNLDAKTISPTDLYSYLDHHNHSSPPTTSILLLDVRTRQAFSAARIEAKHSVCLEPFTLSSASTAASIEASLEVSPAQEKEWFAHRANFDLIVVYDRSTKQLPSRSGRPQLPLTFGSTNGQYTNSTAAAAADVSSQDAKALAILFSAIYELNFSDSGKRLKRSPLLLVGGFEAWEKEIGEKGIYRDAQLAPDTGAAQAASSSSGSYSGGSSSAATERDRDRPASMSAKEAEYQA